MQAACTSAPAPTDVNAPLLQLLSHFVGGKSALPSIYSAPHAAQSQEMRLTMEEFKKLADVAQMFKKI